jgi:GMP synthase-like glutamine amidotransferase
MPLPPSTPTIIGLLLCDHVREEFRAAHGDYPEQFSALFAPIAPQWTFRCYEVTQGEFPARLDECDAYLSTGSSWSVYEEADWIAQTKAFIRSLFEAGIPYVGVCFGHQLLGEALGGKVAKSPNGWCVGVHDFTLLHQDPWMQPPLSTFSLLMMCQDQVMELPPQSTVLASSPACPVGMFRVGTTHLGIQAHPEFTKAYDQALMLLREERMGTAVVEKGISSLDKETDATTIASWIVRFIEQH